jgi:osmotically-inducible protein OsmY
LSSVIYDLEPAKTSFAIALGGLRLKVVSTEPVAGQTLFSSASYAADGGPSNTTTQMSPTEAQLAQTVQAALHADPYVYDAHVTVSVKNGSVVLTGFVTSDWDLRNAIRIATKAAGNIRVIDNLSIKEGGQR